MSKTAKAIIGIIIAIIIAGGIWLAISKNKPSGNNQSADNSIKIGAILPLTGEASSYGQAARKGIDLAVEKVKKEKGIDLEIIYEDDQIDPKKSVDAFQKLVNLDGVKYIMGFGSGETLAVCPLAELNNVILFSAGSSPEITNCGDYTFRDFPSDVYQGKVLAEKVYGKGFNNIALMYINNDYGAGLKDKFKENFKGNIAATEAFSVGEKDFKTQLAKIKLSNPEAIVLISHLAEGEGLLKQRYDLGISQPIFTSEGLKDDNLPKDVPADALKNMYFVYASQYEGAEYQEYKNAYLQKYGEGFGIFSDYVYDNVLALANAIEKSGDPKNIESVKTNLYQTNMNGATGLIKFDKNGDVVDKEYSLYKVANGKFELAE